MYQNKYKTIGILGGMGPAATAYLYQKIIELTPAQHDQDHIPTLMFSLPQIPDRTNALLYGGESPVKMMRYGAEILQKSGADILLMPCNTAHAYIDQLEERLSIPVLNMIKETKNYIRDLFPKVYRVGLLATTGTIKTQVYEKVFADYDVVTPDPQIQEENVMKSIYMIKSGDNLIQAKKLMLDALHTLESKEVDLIILGCTEVPLVIHENDSQYPVLNPMEILSKKAITFAISK